MVRDLPYQVSAVLSILGDSRSRGVHVSISTINGNYLKITGAPSLALGSAVKILEDNRLWLGDVIECHSDGVAVISVLHRLNNLRELTRLAEVFAGGVSDKASSERPGRPQPEPTLS